MAESFAEGRAREHFLSMLLASLLFSFVGFGFVLICGGMSIAVLAVIVGLAGLCLINYLLWGQAMMRATVGEREDEEFRALLEDDWPYGGDQRAPTRFRL